MKIDYELALYFVHKKIIRKSQMSKILIEAQRLDMPFERYMIVNNYCTAVTALKAMGDFYCLPNIELDMLPIDRTLVDKLSYEFIKQQHVMPIFIDKNGVMLVAVGRPLDFTQRSTIATFYAGKIDVVLVPAYQIENYIDSIKASESTELALTSLQGDDKRTEAGQESAILDAEGDTIINTPSVKLLDSIIREAISYHASDIHIEPQVNNIRVRYRIDGDLTERIRFATSHYAPICARLKIMSGINIAERRIPQDGRINMVVVGLSYDFRVSTLPGVYGEKFVIRILDKTSFSFTRTELGFSASENEILDKAINKPHGIVLLTGPTGCGKSTTLYSFLKELNKESVNIITVEDPIEYTLDGINQTQVNTKANLTFATALRSILRQDPDVIMLGEIRDEETAEIAVRAAITGHLVFSTLHTNDAPGAVSRLMDMGVSGYLIADALVCVISQRLVKRLCPACKKKLKANAQEMKVLGLETPISIFKPQGCQFCGNSGYKGRVAVHEILYVDNDFRNAIGVENSLEALRQAAIDNGMTQMFDVCKTYVLKGITSIAELMSLDVN